MKKLIVLFLTAFFTNGLIAQNSCDPQMLDTLTNVKNGDKFLKVYSWSNEDGKQRKNENSFMLRKNTKYSWRVGNSVYSESPIILEFIYVETKISKGEKKEFSVTNKAGKDTTITMRPTKHEPTGSEKKLKKIKIVPGETSKFDVTIPVTGPYNVKLSSTREGSVCTHVALFFVEKYPDE